MAGVLIRRGNQDTDTQRDDFVGRTQGELGQGEDAEGTKPTDTLVLDFWLPKLWDPDVLLLEGMTVVACPGCGASIWLQF